MKDLLFRAWVGDHYEYEGFVIYPDGRMEFPEGGFDLYGEDDGFPVEQYTGLKDKNGVKIFEGDIVGFSSYFFCDTFITAHTEVIEYDVPGFNDSLNIGYQNYPEWCEVIGNIHENPELL